MNGTSTDGPCAFIDGVYSYAAPFPQIYPAPDVAPIIALPVPQYVPYTEKQMRRIIREELQRFDEMLQQRHEKVMRSCKPLDQVLRDLGDAYLLDQHPQEDVAGAD